MILKLPLPPSQNKAYGNNTRGKGRGRYKTAAYKAWLIEADKWLLTQKRGLTPVTGPALVSLNVPMMMPGDASNRIKLTEDFLVSRGLTGDDRKNVHVGVTRCAHVEKGFCEIVVRPA